MMRIFLTLVLIFCSWQGSYALEVPDRVMQGDIVIGRASKGFRVFQDKQAIAVTPEGFFLLAFGRDATGESQVVALSPSGVQQSKRIHIDARQWPIQRLQGLPEKMVEPDPATLERIRQDNERVAIARQRTTREAFFKGGFIWPVDGTITSVFGAQRILNGVPKRFHNGVDIAAPEGTPILAPADGVVALAETDMLLMGGTVVLDHGYGLNTIYVHMQDVKVKVGQRMRQGELLGTVGKTGRATGAHLHWGVAVHNTLVDPERLATLDFKALQ